MRCKLCKNDAAITEAYRIDELRIVRCGNCGLMFLDTSVSEKALIDLYDEQYYRERRKYFFENAISNPQKDHWNENLADFARGLKLLHALLPHRGRLLDVGCGVGIFLALARQEGWQVAGVDISPFAVRYAREVFGLAVYQGPLASLRFPEASFDVVTLWDTLEHLVDPFQELREIHRILKPGGGLLLNTPNEESLLKLIARLLYRTSFGSFHYPIRKLYHRYHLYYFSSSTLVSGIEKAGFQVLTLQKKAIPLVKARGYWPEKAIVRVFSLLERVLGREYELFLIAQK